MAGTAAHLLRRARRRARISQTELARRTGVPQPVISAYERGRREPGVDAAQKLLRALGFRLQLEPATGPDLERAGRVLPDLLGLADAVPSRRPGPLRFPPLPRT